MSVPASSSGDSHRPSRRDSTGGEDGSPAKYPHPDVTALAKLLATGPRRAAAASLQRLIRAETSLLARNELTAYADQLALVVEALPPVARADLLSRLAPADAVIALRGSFRTVERDVQATTFAALATDAAGRLLDEFAVGYDGPREAARLFASVPGETACAALLVAGEQTRLRLLEVMPATDAARFADSARRCLLAGLSNGRRADIAANRSHNEESFAARLRALNALPAEEAAEALSALAAEDPTAAGELLLSLAEWVCTPRGGSVLHNARAAAVLAQLNPSSSGARALLRATDPGRMSDLIRRCPTHAEALARTAALPTPGYAGCAYPGGRARGTRRARHLDESRSGARHVRITEEFTAGDGRHRCRIDLLEFDRARVRLEARRPLGADRLLSIHEAKVRLGGSRTSVRPTADTLPSLGLVRLSDAVEAAHAVAGINGNFYFDYGHVIDAMDLDLELRSVPGLHFGDVFGWYVEAGVEVSPPVYNRAAVVVTQDGSAYIRRVRMTGVRFASGPTLTWQSSNAPRDGGTTLYNGLIGFRTPQDREYVDLSVVGGRVCAITLGGAAPMPLTGFVVSIPRPAAATTLADVRVGDKVEVMNDFPNYLGPVRDAMACGPLLVRDGQVDLDLAAEEFGDKDTACLPFSLSRSVDRFRAARSFVGLTPERLVLGTVSGTQFGSGPPRVSAGMTFGELAQLCADLGLEHAIGLDGGGSSSLVSGLNRFPDGDRPFVLNVPTGGADVPEGTERFINTHWLVFDA